LEDFSMNAETIEQDAARILEVVEAGGVALAQTQTGYGLVAMKSEGVRRIYELKGRPATKPCVTVGTMEILDEVAEVDVPTRLWLSAATAGWPLAVVARLRPASRLVASFEPFVATQCTKADTIATFFGVGPLIARTAELARSKGRLIVGSSANLAGTGNNYALEDVPPSMRDGVDLAIDYGRARYTSDEKLASTIIDLTQRTFLRKGACFEAIEASWRAFEASNPPVSEELLLRAS
jgi:tRNA A37 threonylcarbamoyladenosine synthetase subunit TsaC/SUA5/YrdC